MRAENKELLSEEIRRILASISMGIGIGGDGKELYFDVRTNGTAPTPLFDRVFDRKLEGIYLMFEESGKSFVVTDTEYNVITSINVNFFTKNSFPGGIFPDKQLFVGYGVAPGSNLIVNDVSVLPLK